jgi:hypothetical protein
LVYSEAGRRLREMKYMKKILQGFPVLFNRCLVFVCTGKVTFFRKAAYEKYAV